MPRRTDEKEIKKDQEEKENELLPHPSIKIFKEFILSTASVKITGETPGIQKMDLPSIVEKIPDYLTEDLYIKLHEVVLKADEALVKPVLNFVIKLDEFYKRYLQSDE